MKNGLKSMPPLMWLALILILGVMASAPSRAAAQDKFIGNYRDIRHAKVVAFGDSITHKPEKYKLKHWTDQIKERFDLELINAGVAGNTITGGMARLDRDVLARRPDFVIINFGMNDHVMVAKGKPHVKLEDFESSLVKMIGKIREIGAVPILVTTNSIVEGDRNNAKENYYYNRHDPAFYAEVGGAQAQLDRYIQVVRQVGEKMKVGVADVRKACDRYDNRQFTIDGVHSAQLGQNVYAKVIGDFLEANYAGGKK